LLASLTEPPKDMGDFKTKEGLLPSGVIHPDQHIKKRRLVIGHLILILKGLFLL
jgi:hypothetical protein